MPIIGMDYKWTTYYFLGLLAGSPLLAEKVGFEPTVSFTLRLISSQVHSATLPLLRFCLERIVSFAKRSVIQE